MAGEHSVSLTLLRGHWHIVLGHGAQNEAPVVMPVPESINASMWEPHDNQALPTIVAEGPIVTP